LEAHAIVVDEDDTRLDDKLAEISDHINLPILTDTETGTKYKLTIANGELTLIKIEE
jgi:hypothetical protein